MDNYQLTSKGEHFLHNPPRNRSGQIGTPYFRKLMLIYFFLKKATYRPKEFKKFVESLSFLNDKDTVSMNTDPYTVWKHNIDAAKQRLLPILKKNHDGTFSIEEESLASALREISDYVLVAEESKPEFPEEQVGSPPRVATTVTRTVRDTVLSKRIKRERNHKCQVCGTRLVVKREGYAEAHHVKPLGHGGPDVQSNLLVLCPNHHVLFDYGAIAVLPEDSTTVVDSEGAKLFVLSPPTPKKEYLEYHYNHVYRKVTLPNAT